MPSEQTRPEPLLKGLKVVEMATWLFAPMSACLLGELDALTTIRLNANALTGRIPSKLTTLTNLTHLYLVGEPVRRLSPARPEKRRQQRSVLAILD